MDIVSQIFVLLLILGIGFLFGWVMKSFKIMDERDKQEEEEEINLIGDLDDAIKDMTGYTTYDIPPSVKSTKIAVKCMEICKYLKLELHKELL